MTTILLKPFINKTCIINRIQPLFLITEKYTPTYSPNSSVIHILTWGESLLCGWSKGKANHMESRGDASSFYVGVEDAQGS